MSPVLALPLTNRACCCAGIYIRQPKPKPNKIIDDEDMNKSRIELRLPELLLICEQKDEDLFISQHSSKPHVVRSFFFVSL
ncbi:MAG: hypothetical protein JSS98_20230 [Bacteroidetes bacterium]|nr:hypothetical protein [Bacteroidota bacterium]